MSSQHPCPHILLDFCSCSVPPKKSSKEGPKLAEEAEADKSKGEGTEQNGNDDAPELNDALLDTKIKFLEERLGKASAKEKEFAKKLAEELQAAGKDERELKVKVWTLKAFDAELKASDVSFLLTLLCTMHIFPCLPVLRLHMCVSIMR